jgi:hypothetical protein
MEPMNFDPIFLGWLGALCVLALIRHLLRKKPSANSKPWEQERRR